MYRKIILGCECALIAALLFILGVCYFKPARLHAKVVGDHPCYAGKDVLSADMKVGSTSLLKR